MHGLMCVPSVYSNPQERHINQDTISDSVALAELKETLLISTLLRRGSMASTCVNHSRLATGLGLLHWKANQQKTAYHTTKRIKQSSIMRVPIWGC